MTRKAPSLALAIVAAAAWTSAPAAADGPKLEGDLARLQGTWKAMAGPKKDRPITLVIKGDDATLTVTTRQGAEVELKGTIKLDESKSPRSLDFADFKGPMGDVAGDNLSIYELDDKGDVLRMCSGGPGGGRPDKFEEGQDGQPPRIVIFRRVMNESPAKGVQ